MRARSAGDGDVLELADADGVEEGCLDVGAFLDQPAHLDVTVVGISSGPLVGFQQGGAAGVVLVGAVDGRDERAGVEQDGHAGCFRCPRMISSCRSDRSPRPDSQIPVIDRCRCGACTELGSAAAASSGSAATSRRSRSAWS
jgi:hypothetical protein